MSKRSDPVLKVPKLRSSTARVLGVAEDKLFPPAAHSSKDGDSGASNDDGVKGRYSSTACLCLLNVGLAGFIAIDYDAFASIVQGFGDSVAASWMPHARSFSFVLFKSPQHALQAYEQFHLAPCPQLPGGGRRLGLAAFADPTVVPNLPPSFQAALGLADDLQPLAAVSGLTFQPEFLSESEEEELLSFIHNLPDSEWIPVHGRRVVHFGASFEYSSFSPAHQATISIYPYGRGIPPHIDIPELGTYIVSVSLHSGCTMDFRIPQGEPVHSVYLPPRSLLALEGDARYKYAHGIKERASDEVNGVVVMRGEYRASIVWRAM
ncbi:hypothetical protein BCR44DRAFT_1495469 [Catenaria anguillulae PL171]|uniref:Fe2OG dioxygenase domain-containing protein n=1 Tax=Catenaria anguillulae PL171 TaxID=765915 RepID=A0A1Y2I2D4_9FUNG|nr:hypothetical protein BCR44DRAFT_1495469 [Catenaria anguillulae PL171]